MKNSEFEFTPNSNYIDLFTTDDIEVIRKAFATLNNLFHGEPLKASAEFCKNKSANNILSENGLNVWLNLWTVDIYNNRVVNVQTYLTVVLSITDSEQGIELVRKNGLLTIYDKQ